MLPAIAAISDLEARLGSTITDPDERARAAALLRDASALVRHAAGTNWVDEESVLLADVPDLAVAIACAVTIRAFHNPADIDSTQMGGVSVRYREVWLTRREADLLSRLTRSAGSLELTPGFGFESNLSGWVPVDYGGDYFPFEVGLG